MAPDWPAVRERLAELEGMARADLERSGFSPADTRIERTVDARYVGQIHELITPLPTGELTDAALDQLRDSFDEIHRQRYTYAVEGNPLEYLHWRVSGIGQIERPATEPFADVQVTSEAVTPHATRRAYFPELGEFVDTPVYDSLGLARGVEIEGPAIVDSATTTILVLPGHRLLADGQQSYLVDTGQSRLAGARLVGQEMTA
jgi:N-methylhydantoinase A